VDGRRDRGIRGSTDDGVSLILSGWGLDAFVTLVLLLAGVVLPSPVAAQEGDGCTVLCAPELEFEPTWTVENLADSPRVIELEDGAVADTVRLQRETVFEIVFALDVPTEIPRVGFTFEAIWTPFTDTSENLFTGRTAEDLGEEIDGNPSELEAELNLALLSPEETGGWMDVHFDVVDKLSPAAQPDDDRLFTHKLDFELDAALAAFRWLPEGNWLRNVEVEGSLDYQATGLPETGDEVPAGEQIFLDDASPWSLSVLLVVPVAPLDP